MAGKTNINELARRYVTAVFELAGKGTNLSQISKDFAVIENTLSKNSSFSKMANSPIISSKEQVNAVEQIAKKAKFSKITTNFLKVVASNGRLDILPEIIEAYNDKIAEKEGEITAEITSSVKLAPAILKNIKTELEKQTKNKVIIEENIDPSIIGGLVVKIGSKMYDFSVKSQLSKMRNELKQVS